MVKKKKEAPKAKPSYAERVEALHYNLLNHLEAQFERSMGEPVSHKPEACRYCWGIGHAYQWKTRREYQAALIHGNLDDPNLTEAGGFGYRSTRAPNPACPECGGIGQEDRLLRVLRLFPANVLERITSLDVSDRAVRLRFYEANDLLIPLVRVTLSRSLGSEGGKVEDSFAAALKAIVGAGSSAPIRNG